ncbi:MAG TPA: hypothetical protein VFN68_08930 [Acidimicrobiales bacterium]|nr:hypothetical protein [Acidimicrobiales bacterium]
MTGRYRARVAVGLVVAASGLSACSGSGGKPAAVHTVNPSPQQTVTTAPPTSLSQQVPTVFNCGGGAYEPKTLLVVCGVATTTATGISWTSWTGSGATGSGTVNLSGSSGHGSGPATLKLSKVVQTGNGPQFSLLDVTWTGSSPDGHPSDQFKLAVAPS